MKAKKKAGRPPKSVASATADSYDPGSKARIQEVALRLFAEKGYGGTTVQEIVNKAGTNLSMISYYFAGKENLYKTCLEQAAATSIESTDRILLAPKTCEEFLVRLRLFIDEFMAFHLSNRDLTTIIAKEATNPSPAVRSLFENGFYRSYRTFEAFVQSAHDAKFLKPKLNVHIFSLFFYNSLIAVCREDSCIKALLGKQIEDPEFRKDITEFMVGDFLRGALNQS